MWEGGKHTIPKSVPLTVRISWSDPTVWPRGPPSLCSWTDMIFSHAQSSLGFFRRSKESSSNWSSLLPVLLKKCNIFCQQMKRSPSEVDLHSWTALIQTRPMDFVFFFSILLEPVSKRKLQAGTYLALLKVFIGRFQCWSRRFHSKQSLSWPRLINCPHVLDS